MFATVTFFFPVILALITPVFALALVPFPSTPLTLRRAFRAALEDSLSNFANNTRASPGGDFSLCGVFAAFTALAITPKSASAAISPTIRTGLVPLFDLLGSIFPAFSTPPSTRAAANAFAQFGQKAPYTSRVAFVADSELRATRTSPGDKTAATTSSFIMMLTPSTVEWTHKSPQRPDSTVPNWKVNYVAWTADYSTPRTPPPRRPVTP